MQIQQNSTNQYNSNPLNAANMKQFTLNSGHSFGDSNNDQRVNPKKNGSRNQNINEVKNNTNKRISNHQNIQNNVI